MILEGNYEIGGWRLTFLFPYHVPESLSSQTVSWILFPPSLGNIAHRGEALSPGSMLLSLCNVPWSEPIVPE